ncbi:hypothetical protein EBR03_06675, partial [bacterium]|nr:hypothetical protein [bacterium]
SGNGIICLSLSCKTVQRNVSELSKVSISSRSAFSASGEKRGASGRVVGLLRFECESAPKVGVLRNEKTPQAMYKR